MLFLDNGTFDFTKDVEEKFLLTSHFGRCGLEGHNLAELLEIWFSKLVNEYLLDVSLKNR